ncbi:MAG: diaminopropionate ammonia-lyase [Pseudomonadota bacterium]
MTALDEPVIAHVTGRPRRGDAAERVISRAAFADAWREITLWDGYAATPLYGLRDIARQLDVAAVHYKDEGPRFGLGSFKALGAAYAAMRVLRREVALRTGKDVAMADIRSGACRDACGDITVVSATDGNHGRSLSWGAQQFGAACNIYIHSEVSEGRADAMRAFGANVVRIDGDYDASVILAREEAEKNGWWVVSDTSWPGYWEPPHDVMAGYGVMTREAIDALPEPPTHVVLQGGVGGFAASVAALLRQHYGADAPRVIIAEPERAACLFESARQGRPTTVAIDEETIMAGLSCGEPSPLAWEILEEEASDFVTVPDAMVGPTMRSLARPERGDPAIEAGESAVAGLAAIIGARRDARLWSDLGLDEGSRILVFGTEGITDPEIYAKIMAGADDA